MCCLSVGESDLDFEECLGFLSSVAMAEDEKWHKTHSGRFPFITFSCQSHFHHVDQSSVGPIALSSGVHLFFYIKSNACTHGKKCTGNIPF